MAAAAAACQVVVNVFSEKEKAFYGVEKFWAAGQAMDLSQVVVPNSPATAWGADDEGVTRLSQAEAG